MTRLAFIGCGYMGQLAHLDNYARLPDVELVALAEGRPRLARLVAERYGIPHVYSHHQELLEREDVDGVVSIMGFDLNWGVVRDVLAAGRHVTTEKAMCLTVAGAEEIVRAAREAGRIYQVGYMKRFDPAVRQAREWIAARRADGRSGDLLHVRIWCAHGDWQWGIHRPYFTDERPPDYRCPREARPDDESEEEFRWVISWLNYYSHQTNLLRYLLGEEYEIEYYRPDPHADLALVRTAGGIPAFLEFPHYRVNGWDEGCQVFFQKAVLKLTLPAPLARQQSGRLEIQETGEGGGTTEPYLPPRWAFAEQARAFVAAVRGDGPELSPPEEAIGDIRLAHELVRLRRGRV